MKHLLFHISLMLACACVADESLQTRFDAARRLETEEQNPGEAAAIYRELVAIDASGEDRHIVAQSARRLIAIYQAEQPRTIAEKIDLLKNAPTLEDHVIDTFGEPLAYIGLGGVYTKTNLPDSFSMDYPGNLSITVLFEKISALKIVSLKKSPYSIHGIHMGSRKEKVFEIFPPDGFDPDSDKGRINGVVYTAKKGATISNYRTKHGIEFYFAADRIVSITIHDLDQLRSYTPPTKQEVE